MKLYLVIIKEPEDVYDNENRVELTHIATFSTRVLAENHIKNNKPYFGRCSIIEVDLDDGINHSAD